jgi:hypothetical protein
VPELNEALLTAVGLAPTSAIASLGVDGPDTGVMTWLRVACATSEELHAAGWRSEDAAALRAARHDDIAAIAAAAHRAYQVMGTCMAPVNRRNEHAALSRLLAALDAQCEAYPCSLDEHGARLHDAEARPWAHGVHAAEVLALRALVSERLALEESAECVRKALGGLIDV